MIRRPPRSTRLASSAASDVYKRQVVGCDNLGDIQDIVLSSIEDVLLELSEYSPELFKNKNIILEDEEEVEDEKSKGKGSNRKSKSKKNN